MVRGLRVFLAAAALASVVALPTVSQAYEGEADGRRITVAGHALTWNWTPVGKANSYGHAETLINAPIDKVRAAVLDYAHYKDFNPARFTASRVVGHPEGASDVYMQFGVLKGMLRFGTSYASPRRRASCGRDTRCTRASSSAAAASRTPTSSGP